jgi:hypothetical protein
MRDKNRQQIYAAVYVEAGSLQESVEVSEEGVLISKPNL